MSFDTLCPLIIHNTGFWSDWFPFPKKWTVSFCYYFIHIHRNIYIYIFNFILLPVMLIGLLRYAHVIEKHQNCVLNVASLFTGWICAAGLFILGIFPVRIQKPSQMSLCCWSIQSTVNDIISSLARAVVNHFVSVMCLIVHVNESGWYLLLHQLCTWPMAFYLTKTWK